MKTLKKLIKFNLFVTVLLLLNVKVTEAALGDYINGITKYFGYETTQEDGKEIYGNEFMQKIPYEVSTLDEKFISEAVKLTGVAVSDLDTCQQRVVLKLKTDCHKMNDEQLAKMAVHLLNCQSHVEGRRIFPCTDEMSIKDCTTDMDSDTWTSYHLMSNRARAVCYMIRQSQFRGLAEHTVNRLMDASKDQLKSLGQIAQNQENILNIAETTYDTLSKAHEELSEQQHDLQKAQLHSQLVLEGNIMRLADEKRLIHESHNKLIQMTMEVQNKLANSAQMIEGQNNENRLNHKELLNDLSLIHSKAEDLFDKINAYSEILLKQNQEFKSQYESTLRNLQEVNKTVHTLVNLVGGTKQALEERLSWIMTALGGTDQAVERLYLVLWHLGFILAAMISCAFLSARPSTRLVVAGVPPLNLALALSGHDYFDILTLGSVIGGFVTVQTLVLSAIKVRKSIQPIAWHKQPSESSTSLNLHEKRPSRQPFNYHETSHSVQPHQNDLEDDETNHDHNETDHFDDFRSLTPPISRNGHYSSIRSRSRSNTPLKSLYTSLRASCRATTRAGTPCKLTSLPGRDFCYRHQNGDSVMG